jgi:hypothetical protein
MPKSKPQATQQKSTACASCPLIRSGDPSYCFDPNVLEKTVVEYLNKGCLHPCHSQQQKMCTGYLSFVKQHVEGGIYSFPMARLAIALKFLKPILIPNLDTFESVEEMLKSHSRRNWRSSPVNLDDE